MPQRRPARRTLSARFASRAQRRSLQSVDELARSLFFGFNEGHFGDPEAEEKVSIPASFVDTSSRLYALTGVIQHTRHGESSGHYVSYTRNGRGGWLIQDDSTERIYTSEVTQLSPCVALYLRREQPSSCAPKSRWKPAPFDRKPTFYYGVAEGRSPGVYTTWEETKREVSNYRGAVHKRFVLRESAQRFVERYNPPKGGPVVTPPPGDKWYAVVRGRKTGLYDCWREASSMVNGYSKNQYKAFDSREEASLYWWDHMAGGPQQDSPRMCLFFASHKNSATGKTGAAACLLDTLLHKLTASWVATLDTADLGSASYYAALKGIQEVSQRNRNTTWSCRGDMSAWSVTTRTRLVGAVPATWSFLDQPNVNNNCAQFKAEEASSQECYSLTDVQRRVADLERELGVSLTPERATGPEETPAKPVQQSKKPRSPDSDPQAESTSAKKPKAEADRPPLTAADPDGSPRSTASPKNKKQWSPGSDSQDEPVPLKKPKTSVSEVAQEATDPPEKVGLDASEEPANTHTEGEHASGELADTFTKEVRDTSDEPADSLTNEEHDAAVEPAGTLTEGEYASGELTDTPTNEVRGTSEESVDILTKEEHDASVETEDALTEGEHASGEPTDTPAKEDRDTFEEPVGILTKGERELSSPSSQPEEHNTEIHTPPIARTLILDSPNNSTEEPTPKTRRARSSPPRTGTSGSDASTNDAEDVKPTCDHAPPMQKGPRVKCDFCRRLLQRKWLRSRCTKCQITTCRRCWTAGEKNATRALAHPDGTPRHGRTRSCPSPAEKTKKKLSPYSSADSEKTNLSPGKRLKDDC